MSRRKFTKEFKEEAVRRLELGASLAEVARACEVNPNVLHRWKRELRDYGAKTFSGNGQRRAEDQQVAWSVSPDMKDSWHRFVRAGTRRDNLLQLTGV